MILTNPFNKADIHIGQNEVFKVKGLNEIESLFPHQTIFSEEKIQILGDEIDKLTH